MGNAALHSRILVLGIDGAGKTSFLNRVVSPNQQISPQPTEAYKIYDVKIKGVKFNVWDVAGKESTRSLWKHYYKEGGCDAVIWVIDSADKERLEESKKWLNSAMMDPALAGVILYVLANKSDLEGAISPEELEKKLDLEKYRANRPCFIHGISALEGRGIKDAMDHLAREIKLFYKGKA